MKSVICYNNLANFDYSHYGNFLFAQSVHNKDEVLFMATQKGVCHICGEDTELTFEHVPPRQALNNLPTKIYAGEEVIKRSLANTLHDTAGLRYKNLQRGAGRHSLCRRCNNNTGSFYAPHYIEFVKHIAYKLSKENLAEIGSVSLETKEMNCLAVFKQIISMFCSTCSHDAFGGEFKEFLLDKENVQFDAKRWGVYLYIYKGNLSSSCSGLMSQLYKHSDNEPVQYSLVAVSEIVTYPLGMVLFDRNTQYPADQIGLDISGMSNIQYGQKPHIKMDLPCLEHAAFMPGI